MEEEEESLFKADADGPVPDQILEEAAAAKIRPYRMARDEYDRDYLCNVMHT